MKVVTVVGTRPQLIKAAPVSRALSAAGIDERLLDTGQHYDDDMSQAFFRELALPPPAYSLGVGSDTHGRMTARMIEGIEAALMTESPDAVLVYGDTNSTLAGALAAAKLGIQIGHVEAGLRSFRPSMPEEINRRLTDHCSTLLFCPTATAVRQLKAEGLAHPDTGEAQESLEQCQTLDIATHPFAVNIGDVMVDALLSTRAHYEHHPPAIDLPDDDFVLLTLHRAENTDDPEILSHIIRQVFDLATALPVLFPVHPRTRECLERYGLWQEVQSHPGIRCESPLSYGAVTWVQANAKVIVTDSGGIQKEAAILGVPCVTLRDETEWVETVSSGWNRLLGNRPESLRDAALHAEAPRSAPLTCFGDGHAADRIAAILSRI